MKKDKWMTKTEELDAPYVVVLMTSRNKDNKNVENFVARRQARFCSYNWDKIHLEFEHFAKSGVPGEMSRLYISLNARDPKKVQKQLLHVLIDNENIRFDHIEAMVAGIAARKENACEKKWFFDFDVDNTSVKDFVNDILDIAPDVNPECLKTPHGYAVVVQHGFDTRKLMEKWSDVASLKRDDLLCMSWKVNTLDNCTGGRVY